MPQSTRQEVAQPLRRSERVKTAEIARNQVQDSRLLNIAPELRNAIWNLVLGDEKIIKLRRAGKIEPALLAVCRQIRCEAGLMWYSAQTFRIRVEDGDAERLIAFTKHVATLPSDTEIHLSVEPWCMATAENMYEWCYAIWLDEGCDALAWHEAGDAPDGSIVKATQIAEEYRGKSWEKCQAALKKNNWDGHGFGDT